MLPTMNHLIKNGASMNLISTIPPLTPPAWTSMMTGKNPGKHGVFHFYEHDGKFLVNSRSVKAKSLWEILSVEGKKVIVINMPLTYPAKRVNGYMISGFLTPDERSNFTYPKMLKDKILKMGYKILSDLTLKGNEKYQIAELKESVKTRLKTALWLLTHYSWDFAAVIFMETDQVQHFYFRNPHLILEVYLEIEKAIEELINQVPRGTYTIIVSDHGFGARRCSISLNAYFYQLGILRIKSTRFVIKRLLNEFLRIMFNRLNVFRGYLVILLEKISSHVPLRNEKNIIENIIIYLKSKSYVEYLAHDFDLSRSVAYSPFPWFDHTNYAIVRLLSHSKKVKKWLIKKIYGITNPKTGASLVKNIYDRGDVYWGKYTFRGPDLIIEFKEDCSGNYSFIRNESWFKEFNDGMHYRNGIAIFNGPDIKEGVELDSHAMIWDICPTILHMLNLPIPKDMDGRVLIEIFKPESKIAKRESIYAEEVSVRKKIKEKTKLRIEQLKKIGKIL